MTRRPHRRRGRGERGAVFVELAVVAPVLLLLVMGIIDFASLSSDAIGLRGGVREAAWNSSRGIFGAPPGTDCALTFSGPAPDANTQKIMCLVKRRSGLPAGEIRVAVKVIDIDGSTVTSLRTGAGVMVCAIRDARSSTGFFSRLLDHKVQQARLVAAVVAIDPSATTIGGGTERPVEGPDDWAFCDPTAATPT